MDLSGDKTKTIAVGAILLILIAAAIWYWQKGIPSLTAPEPIKTTDDAIGAIAVPAAGQVPTNPVEGKVPELNPVDRANPFNNAYRNPFE